MRIVSGKYKGRRLTPGNLPVRPTTDFAKEGLFNVLNNVVDFESLRVLDLFAGTGSISFEFLSRGAKEVMSVDSNHRCISFIKKTSQILGTSNLKAVRSDCFVFIRQMTVSYDLIFADPPYNLERLSEIPDMVLSSGLLAPGGVFILEHGSSHAFDDNERFAFRRRYGNVCFSFFVNP